MSLFFSPPFLSKSYMSSHVVILCVSHFRILSHNFPAAKVLTALTKKVNTLQDLPVTLVCCGCTAVSSAESALERALAQLLTTGGNVGHTLSAHTSELPAWAVNEFCRALVWCRQPCSWRVCFKCAPVHPRGRVSSAVNAHFLSSRLVQWGRLLSKQVEG